MVRVRRSENFILRLRKLDKNQIDRIEKLIFKIVKNPEIGKPMRFDRKDTREVYAGSFRLSYSYFKDEEIIFLLDFYHKDEQ
ncbi:MAG: type II toxin-antitoxin system RelE/ParE family toxin [Nanoarchaeota archaeon]|nr:type II toxin-antitoxin system RelE/ParE family toxin [Nanoarchaeota archaeon]